MSVLAVLAVTGQEAFARDIVRAQVIFSFRNLKGEDPRGDLVADAAGNLYGTTNGGGAPAFGLVYELSPPAGGRRHWTQTILHTFLGAEGANPYAGLIRDAAGNLYGTTELGGSGERGVVFEVSPPAAGKTQWKQKVIFAFNGPDGATPLASLVADPAGNLYGTASGGGRNQVGVAFELRPPPKGHGPWNERILHTFHREDGKFPSASLIFDEAGNLFGTTPSGGANGAGVVFELSPPAEGQTEWTQTVLHSFDKSDGRSPSSPLIADPAGNLYGVTQSGGPHACDTFRCGLVYELSPPTGGQTVWTETVIHAFRDRDGFRSIAGLLRDGAGNLYGVTSEGGLKGCQPIGCGVVFRLSPPAEGQTDWTETVLHDFDGADGVLPNSALIQGPAGDVFGTTLGGGTHSAGVVFRLSS